MAEADPQTTFNVHDAKTHLSRLIERALAGEDIVVARAGKPCIRLVPVHGEPLPPRTPGRFKGLLGDIPDSVWFDPCYTEAELEAFEARSIFPDDGQ